MSNTDLVQVRVSSGIALCHALRIPGNVSGKSLSHE